MSVIRTEGPKRGGVGRYARHGGRTREAAKSGLCHAAGGGLAGGYHVSPDVSRRDARAQAMLREQIGRACSAAALVDDGATR